MIKHNPDEPPVFDINQKNEDARFVCMMGNLSITIHDGKTLAQSIDIPLKDARVLNEWLTKRLKELND